MPDKMINSISGRIAIGELGKTLMHEHLVVGFSGFEGDTKAGAVEKREMVARCVDIVAELKDNGFRSLLDPCPNDLGRDIDIMGEVAARTGFNILFATGLYDDRYGGSYWKAKVGFDEDAEKYIADMYVAEIEQGVGKTGCRPAVIKVATGPGPFTGYERAVMRAAVAAARITGVPITTHTDGIDGDAQAAILQEGGVAPERIIVGHSCGSNDHGYHRKICDAGCYIGFDRFGMEMINTDENRIVALEKMISAGFRNHLIVSHDCTMNMRGQMIGQAELDKVLAIRPMHFTREIAPKLEALGIAASTIDSILVDNPRRYFSGEAPQRPTADDLALPPEGVA